MKHRFSYDRSPLLHGMLRLCRCVMTVDAFPFYYVCLPDVTEHAKRFDTHGAVTLSMTREADNQQWPILGCWGPDSRVDKQVAPRNIKYII